MIKLDLQHFAQDDLIGTWTFNDTIVSLESESNHFEANLDFTFDNPTFPKFTSADQLNFGYFKGSDTITLSYINNALFIEDAAYTTYPGSKPPAWALDTYKTITITDTSKLTNRDEFVKWFSANSNYGGSVPPKPSGKTKTYVIGNYNSGGGGGEKPIDTNNFKGVWKFNDVLDFTGFDGGGANNVIISFKLRDDFAPAYFQQIDIDSSGKRIICWDFSGENVIIYKDGVWLNNIEGYKTITFYNDIKDIPSVYPSKEAFMKFLNDNATKIGELCNSGGGEPKDELQGTWLFNKTLTTPPDIFIEKKRVFLNAIIYTHGLPPNVQEKVKQTFLNNFTFYDNTLVLSGKPNDYYISYDFATNQWDNSPDPVDIEIQCKLTDLMFDFFSLTAEEQQAFLTWLKANAVKQ